MFWQFPQEFLSKDAVIYKDSDNHYKTLTYSDLKSRIRLFTRELPDTRQPVCLVCKNDLNTLVAYLACLVHKTPMLLTDYGSLEEQINSLSDLFGLSAVIKDGKVASTSITDKGRTIDSRLALMISTSGSTGSAKQVALSYDNLTANAESICQYLPIQQNHLTVTTLPFHYSYGLSVINTHLATGACILLSENPVTSREFWDLLENYPINSLAGVPHTYEMLNRLGFLRKEYDSIHYLTQAGGHLANDLAMQFAQHLGTRNKGFFVMYGQTEATARMAWLPPEKLPQKPGSIGSAIPGGRFTLEDEHQHAITQSNKPGELVYRGPNVMLGYATSVQELEHFTPPGKLYTGDIATRDTQGDFFVVGRKKRIVKIFGTRTNLDEVEKLLDEAGFYAKAVGTDKLLYIALVESDKEQEVRQLLARKLSLHISVIKVKQMESFPLKSNQKTDYSALLALFKGEQAND